MCGGPSGGGNSPEGPLPLEVPLRGYSPAPGDTPTFSGHLPAHKVAPLSPQTSPPKEAPNHSYTSFFLGQRLLSHISSQLFSFYPIQFCPSGSQTSLVLFPAAPQGGSDSPGGKAAQDGMSISWWHFQLPEGAWEQGKISQRPNNSKLKDCPLPCHRSIQTWPYFNLLCPPKLRGFIFTSDSLLLDALERELVPNPSLCDSMLCISSLCPWSPTSSLL